MRIHVYFYMTVIAALLPILASTPSHAQQPAKAPAKSTQQIFRSDNAIIYADILTYYPSEKVVKASGHVEISQSGRILMADEVTYIQNTGVVQASGNISLMEPDGSVFFAKQVELKDDLKQGVIELFSARFNDNSLLASSGAIRENENVTHIKQAVYSPCMVCEGYADETPVWQIRADEVTIDTKEQQVTYDNAFFEFQGLPVLYTPYLSHATPGADRKSGFLIPSYNSINTLGSTVKIPYYLNIAPNMDATIAPIYTGLEGPVLSGEFRHLTEKGKYLIEASITHPDKRDNSTGRKVDGQEIRGHINGYGNFDLGDDWSSGFIVRRSSDDTYLRRYKFGEDDLLTSSVYLQQTKNRNYLGIQGVSFQGLNTNDDPDTTPLILPLAESHVETEPRWMNSYFDWDTNLLALYRSEGAESRRISNTVAWHLPYTTGNGQLLEFKTSLRADGYDVNNVPDPASSVTQDGLVGRIIPEVELDWSWPLIRQDKNLSTIIEPVVQLIVSPNGNNPDKIPNEDGQEQEISDMNLFSSNHTIGLDLVEGGPRTNYGFRGLISAKDIGDITFLFGQNYRAKSDENFSAESGLDKNFSDYVGRIGLSTLFLGRDLLSEDEDDFIESIAHLPPRQTQRASLTNLGEVPFNIGVDANYSFRLDKESFTPRRNELNNNLTLGPASFGINYLQLNEGPTNNPTLSREEVGLTGALQLTEFWSLNGNTRRDLSESNAGFVNGDIGLLFSNECMIFSVQFNRDFTSDRDVEPSKSLIFQIHFKNLNY